MKFDEFLFTYLGDIGRYQKIQFTLVCLPTIIVAMHALSWTLSAVPVPFRCALPSETRESPYFASDPRFTIKKCEAWDGTIVGANETGAPGVHCYYNQQCEVDGETCDVHVFDRSRVRLSAMDRWELVCDRGSIRAHVQVFYYVGQMIGSFVFGMLGDRIGRKKVFMIAIALQITCGLADVFAPTWWSFAIFRAGIGFSHPGIFVIAIVVGMELVGPKYRKLAAVITGGCFAIGQVILALEASFVTDYRYLQFIVTMSGVIFLSYWWLVPESPRWLVAQRRFTEADKILQKAAKINGVTLPEKWWEQLDSEKSETVEKTVRKYKVWDLFKTPVLRKRALVTFFLWPCVSMVYYGMAMKPNILGGDMYVNFIFAAAVEIPALILVYLTIDRLGRRIVTCCGYFLAGACLLTNYLMGENATFWVSLAQMVISKGAICGTYAAIYTYTPELYPTVMRNMAVGCCSMIARLGAITATYLSLWIAELPNGKVYMIVPFAIMALASALLTLLFLPETMGKPLPETIGQVEGEDEEAIPQEMQPLKSQEPDEQNELNEKPVQSGRSEEESAKQEV